MQPPGVFSLPPKLVLREEQQRSRHEERPESKSAKKGEPWTEGMLGRGPMTPLKSATVRGAIRRSFWRRPNVTADRLLLLQMSTWRSSKDCSGWERQVLPAWGPGR